VGKGMMIDWTNNRDGKGIGEKGGRWAKNKGMKNSREWSVFMWWRGRCCTYWILLSTCIRKEIIFSWGDSISYTHFTAKNVPCLLSRMLHNPIGIGLEVSKVEGGGGIVISWEFSRHSRAR
jgi:hypothetical protein